MARTFTTAGTFIGTIVVLSVCAALFIALRPSIELSIDNSCQITGAIPTLRSFVQGQRYWSNQLQLLDQEITRLEAWPETRRALQDQQANIDKFTEGILEENRKFLEELYSKHPELRPSPSSTAAQALRKAADAIERAEALESVDRITTQHMVALRTCRPKILALTHEGS